MLFVEVARRFEDAILVVDAYDLLEQRGVAARQHHRFVDQVVELLLAARREQVVHHDRRVHVAERRQLDERMPVDAVKAPPFAPREKLRTPDADE